MCYILYRKKIRILFFLKIYSVRKSIFYTGKNLNSFSNLKKILEYFWDFLAEIICDSIYDLHNFSYSSHYSRSILIVVRYSRFFWSLNCIFHWIPHRFCCNTDATHKPSSRKKRDSSILILVNCSRSLRVLKGQLPRRMIGRWWRRRGVVIA